MIAIINYSRGVGAKDNKNKTMTQ